jgi:hypothetical protein
VFRARSRLQRRLTVEQIKVDPLPHGRRKTIRRVGHKTVDLGDQWLARWSAPV